METLSQLEAREHRVRERLHRFETLTAERAWWQAQVERYSTEPVDLSALTTIYEQLGAVPKDLVTSGVSADRFNPIPGNLVVRDLLMTIVTDALNTAAQRRQQQADRLAHAQAKLASAEKALAALEQESD
jgi:hypothetical protein